MAYTRHGHHVPNTPTDGEPKLASECGYPEWCGQCMYEIGKHLDEIKHTDIKDDVALADDYLLVTMIEKLISDLDRARADGHVYTYGQVQYRLRELLAVLDSWQSEDK